MAETRKAAEMQKKLQEFLNREIGSEYLCILSYVDKKPDASSPEMRFSNVVASNASPHSTPFAVYHNLLKGMEQQIRSILTANYGGELRMDAEEPKRVAHPQYR